MTEQTLSTNRKLAKLSWTTEEYKAMLPCHNVNCLAEVVEKVNAVSKHVRSTIAVQHAVSRKGIKLLKKPTRINVLQKEADAILERMAHWKSSKDGSYENALNDAGYYKKLELIEKLKNI